MTRQTSVILARISNDEGKRFEMSVNSSDGQQKSEAKRDFPDVYSYTHKRISLKGSIHSSLHVET
jgi:hypothetical protein